MSMRDEIKIITDLNEKSNTATTAEMVVEAAKNKLAYPLLHGHLWEVSETELATEARVGRAHRLLISIRIVTDDGDNTRMLVHTRGMSGYRSAEYVSTNADLSLIKLNQLSDDIGRARARLREFKAILPVDVSARIDASLEAAQQATQTVAVNSEAAA